MRARALVHEPRVIFLESDVGPDPRRASPLWATCAACHGEGHDLMDDAYMEAAEKALRAPSPRDAAGLLLPMLPKR